MRIKAAGRNATMVLLNAGASSVRVADALNIRRHVLGDESPMSTSAAVSPRVHAAAGGLRIRASVGGHGHHTRHHVVVTRHRRHR